MPPFLFLSLGQDHAAGDHEQHRFHLPRSLLDPSSTTDAARAQVDRE